MSSMHGPGSRVECCVPSPSDPKMTAGSDRATSFMPWKKEKQGHLCQHMVGKAVWKIQVLEIVRKWTQVHRLLTQR